MNRKTILKTKIVIECDDYEIVVDSGLAETSLDPKYSDKVDDLVSAGSLGLVQESLGSLGICGDVVS